MLFRNISFTPRSVISITRRHFAALTPLTNVQQANGARNHEAQQSGELIYTSSGSDDGRFYIEQLYVWLLSCFKTCDLADQRFVCIPYTYLLRNEHWRSAVAGQNFNKGDVIGSAPGTLVRIFCEKYAGSVLIHIGK